MTTLLKFNMNNSVKVRLNDIGRTELKRQHDNLAISVPSLREYEERRTDKDGYCSFQLHDLMYTFGHMMSLGGNTPFETPSVRIPKVLLKECK